MSPIECARPYRRVGVLGFRKSLSRIQLVGVLLLYPGFFFYHFSVAIWGVPSVLGGYYGALTSLLFPVLGVLFVYGVFKKHIKINRMDASFLFLGSYCLLWSLIYKIFGNGYQADADLFNQSISGVLIWTTNYLLFRGGFDIQKRSLVLLILLSSGMLAITWVNQGDGVFIARRLTDAAQDVASYQGFARSAAVVLFILMAWVSRPWLMLVYYLGLVLLFLLSARSEFGAFVVVGFAILIVRIGVTRMLLLASPALIVGVTLLWEAAYEFSDSSRILRLVLNWQDDTSLASRLDMISGAWDTIRVHPILGDYGSYLISEGVGGYAHNILSVWAGFGLVGFVVFSYLLLSSIRVSLSAVRMGAGDSKGCLSFGLALFGLILAITAKFMFFPLFAASWGAAAGLIEMQGRDRTFRVGGD